MQCGVACLVPSLISHYFVRPLTPRASLPCIFSSTSVLGQSLDCALISLSWHHVVLAFAFTSHNSSLPSFTPFRDGTRIFTFIIPETGRCPFYATNCFTQQANHPLLYSNYHWPLVQMPLIKFLACIATGRTIQ
jgi:hypothetical protein